MTELEEENAYLAYVHRYCLTAVQPTIRMELCRRFLEGTGSNTDPRDLYQRARRIPVNFEAMDPVERMRIYFTLSIPVKDLDFLAKLRENADVDLDNQSHIIKYWSNDGSIKLEGSHSRKDKVGYGATPRRSIVKRDARWRDSDDEEEEEEEEYTPTTPSQKRLRGGTAQLIPTGMGAGTSSFVLSPAAQGASSNGTSAGSGSSGPVAQLNQHVRVQGDGSINDTPMTQEAPIGSSAPMLGAHKLVHPDQHGSTDDTPAIMAPIGENRAPSTGIPSIGAQNAVRSEHSTAQVASSAKEVVQRGIGGAAQLIPTGMESGTSSFVLSPAAQGVSSNGAPAGGPSTSSAPMLGAHNFVHPDQHGPTDDTPMTQGAPIGENRVPSTGTLPIGAQTAATAVGSEPPQGAASAKEVAQSQQTQNLSTENPVPAPVPMLGSHNLVHPDGPTDDISTIMAQGAPIGENRAETSSVGAQPTVRSEPSTAQNAVSAKEVVQSPRRTENPVPAPTHSRSNTSKAQGSPSIQPASKRTPQENKAADRLSSSQGGPSAKESTPVNVQEVVQCQQAQDLSSGNPVPALTNGGQQSGLDASEATESSSIQQALKRILQQQKVADHLASFQGGPSTVQEVVQSQDPQNSETTGSGAPNSEPGADVMAPSGFELSEDHSAPNSKSVAPATGSATVQTHTEDTATTGSSNTCVPQAQQAASGAQNSGTEASIVARNGIEQSRQRQVTDHDVQSSGSTAPATQEQAEGVPINGSWNTGSQQALVQTSGPVAQVPLGALSSEDEWCRQQLRQLIQTLATGFGPAMAQNCAQAAPGAPGSLPPWATSISSAPNELKPSLSDSKELVTFEAQKKFLDHLLDIIDGQRLPVGEWVVENVRRAMESVKKWQIKAQNLNIGRFTCGVEACLEILTNYEHVEEGPRFRSLLVLLHQTVFLMKTPSLAPLLEKIQEVHNNTPEDKKVDPKKLQNGIYTLIEILY